MHARRRSQGELVSQSPQRVRVTEESQDQDAAEFKALLGGDGRPEEEFSSSIADGDQIIAPVADVGTALPEPVKNGHLPHDWILPHALAVRAPTHCMATLGSSRPHTGGAMRKILYIDMDNVLVDFQSGIDRLDVPTLIKFEGRYDEVPGIFSLMEPMPGAVDAYHTLAEAFDTFILSTAPWLNPSAWSDKNLWVREHLGDVETVTKRLILTHHKHLNHGDFLIDDRPNNGADRFAGTWIEFGHRDWPDWPAVTDYLLDRA